MRGVALAPSLVGLLLITSGCAEPMPLQTMGAAGTGSQLAGAGAGDAGDAAAGTAGQPVAGAAAAPPPTAGTLARAGDASAGPSAGTRAEQEPAAGTAAVDASVGDDAAVAPDAAAGEFRLPPGEIDGDGAFSTSQDLNSGPAGSSGLFHPVELGRGDLKHPIFLWGCGGGSRPSSYVDHMGRIASHGFVALAVVSNVGDGGDVLRDNLNWLLAEAERSDSPLYGKLETTRIAAGGHSIGSVNTFLMADDPRLLTTVHVAGGSLDNVNNPFAPTTGMGGKALIHPAAFIGGQTDTFNNTEKLEQDYAATAAPVFFTVIQGSDHISAAREGLPLIVAWLRWQVAGETMLGDRFLDPGGSFRTGRYQSQVKNW